MSNMCDLPDELVAEVLARVKDKMVPRLKCVSKSWKTLIERPEFLHLRYKGIPQLIYLSWEDNWFHTMEIIRGDQNHVMKSKDKKQIKGRGRKDHARFISSCNGVLFLKTKQDLVLQNPCTKQLVTFPRSIMPDSDGFPFGFGYDNVHDDYKAVALTGRSVHDIRKAVVYSLRSKPKSCIDFNVDGSYMTVATNTTTSVFANGALHWFMRLSDYPSSAPTTLEILAVDLSTESYRLVPPPAGFIDQSWRWYLYAYGFGEVDGCLILFKYNGRINLEAWIMKEYGVQDSWTKLRLLPPNSFQWDKNLLRCNFDARSVIEPRRMESIDYMAFRVCPDAESEEDDLILWYPKKWKGVYTFTPNFFSFPTPD